MRQTRRRRTPAEGAEEAERAEVEGEEVSDEEDDEDSNETPSPCRWSATQRNDPSTSPSCANRIPHLERQQISPCRCNPNKRTHEAATRPIQQHFAVIPFLGSAP